MTTPSSEASRVLNIVNEPRAETSDSLVIPARGSSSPAAYWRHLLRTEYRAHKDWRRERRILRAKERDFRNQLRQQRVEMMKEHMGLRGDTPLAGLFNFQRILMELRTKYLEEVSVSAAAWTEMMIFDYLALLLGGDLDVATPPVVVRTWNMGAMGP